MILGDGTVNGRRLLSPGAVRHMTTNHLMRRQREIGELFLEGQGWGFGASVDVEAIDPWNVPGRYGWVGGTGTTAHHPRPLARPTSRVSKVLMTGLLAPFADAYREVLRERGGVFFRG